MYRIFNIQFHFDVITTVALSDSTINNQLAANDLTIIIFNNNDYNIKITSTGHIKFNQASCTFYPKCLIIFKVLIFKHQFDICPMARRSLSAIQRHVDEHETLVWQQQGKGILVGNLRSSKVLEGRRGHSRITRRRGFFDVMR